MAVVAGWFRGLGRPLAGLAQLDTGSLIDSIGQSPLPRISGVQIDRRGTVRRVPHALHQLTQIRVRVGGVVVPGVAQVVEVHAGQARLPDSAAPC
jgi:hypothetical protein